MNKYKFETITVHGNKGYDEKTGAVSTPIYQSATFRHLGLNQSTGYDYSRLQNPTREELEKTIALLDNGKEALAFSSGMAAVSTIIKLFKSGDHIIVCDDLYGGTYRIFEEIYSHFGITTTYVDLTEKNALKKYLKKETVAIWVESPTNPMMKVVDIEFISSFAKENNILSIVDNTFLTSYCIRPLDYEIDLVVYSGTKYLAGHNDTLAGFVVTKTDYIIEKLRLIQKSEGAVLAPFDSWLVLRGLKTLHIRMDRQCENAIKLAEFLSKHKNVTKVYFPGLPEHKEHEIIKKQSKAFGAMISFEVNSIELVEKVLREVKLIMFAESLGGVDTLITYPFVQTHSAIPEELRNKLGVNEKLLRLSVGIENVNDLLEDLENALR